MLEDPERAKKTDKLDCIFGALGSAHEKVTLKRFVKLTPNFLFFSVRCGVGSTDQKINMQSPSELRQIRHSGQFDDDQVRDDVTYL